MTTENPVSIVLMSGGMNCAVMVLHMVRKLQRPIVEAMIFDRLTPSGGESAFAKRMATRAGIGYSTWPLQLDPILDMGLDHQPDEREDRNEIQLARALMFTQAAFRAKQRGASRILVGFLAEELNMLVDDLYLLVGAVSKFAGLEPGSFEFPLMQFNKGDVFELARKEDLLVEVGFHTMSCLRGEEEQFSWGYGCGECTGCERRAAGWEIYLEGLKK